MSGEAAVNPIHLGTTDYVTLGIMLLISLGIGVFFAITGRKNATKAEYLVGSRRMGALPVCLSLFATFQSAISLLGVPAEVYTYGIMNIYTSVGIVLSNLLCIVTIIPLIHPLKVTSVNEYLQMRFQSRTVRLLGTLIGVISSMSYMTVALLSPALALQTAVDVPLWLSIVLIGAVGTAYTAIGGIKSVVWTDVFQTVIIFGGIVVILIKESSSLRAMVEVGNLLSLDLPGLPTSSSVILSIQLEGSLDVGGMGNVIQIASDNGRIIVDDVSPDPRVRHTVWGLVIGGCSYWFGAHFSQSSVQRIVAIKSEQQARLTFIMATILSAIYGVIMILTGLVLLAYFFSIECDPLKAKYIQNRNQMMPYFVMQSLSFLPGLPGLYMATIFSGALSTLSSGINSLTANTVEDFLGRVLANKRESTVTAISKAIVCAYGAGIICLAYLAREMSGPVTQTTYTALGATSGPLVGIFVLGATFPQANAVGTVFGLLMGLAINVWISIGTILYGAPKPQLPPGPVDKCFAQNASVSIGTWNSSWVDQITQAHTTVSYTAAPTTIRTTRSTAIGRDLQDSFSFYDLSYVWTPLIGLLVTVILGLIASIIFGYFQKSKQQPSPSLFFPFVRRFIKFETMDKEIGLLSDFSLKAGSQS